MEARACVLVPVIHFGLSHGSSLNGQYSHKPRGIFFLAYGRGEINPLKHEVASEGDT